MGQSVPNISNHSAVFSERCIITFGGLTSDDEGVKSCCVYNIGKVMRLGPCCLINWATSKDKNKWESLDLELPKRGR